MDWIKVEGPTPNKPEILKLARILGVSRHDAFGKAMCFWLWLDGVSVDGVVDGVAPTDVDAVVGADGFAAALQLVGWLEIDEPAERLVVPNFDNHNGETAKKRVVKSRRQSRWRNTPKAPVDGRVGATVDGSVGASASTFASTREDKIREDKKGEEKDIPLPSLERLIDGWNKTGLFPKQPQHPNAPHLVGMFTAAWSVPCLQEYLATPDAIIAELKQATWMHGKPNLTLGWLLEQKPNTEPKLLKLMSGAYRSFDSEPESEPEPPQRVVIEAVERQRVIDMRKRTGRVF